MTHHERFIRTSITTILDEAAVAVSCINASIEACKICEYFMQTVFLKMTGFQEQKMKCVCWDMATDDYEYRYERFRRKPLGECSSYDEKCTVYKDVVNCIKKKNLFANYCTDLQALPLKAKVTDALEKFHDAIKPLGWLERQYMYFRDVFLARKDCCFLDRNLSKYFANCENCPEHDDEKKEVAKRHKAGAAQKKKCTLGSLVKVYEENVYGFRNACAHNTQAYKATSFTLEDALREGQTNDNYFVRFALLVAIDEITIAAFKIWADSANAKNK